MRSSTSGLLLLLIGALAMVGFLTGNLDRWLGYLFSATGAPVATTVAPAGASSHPGSTVAIATNNQRVGALPAGVA